jgi:adenylate cyclase
VESPLPDRQGYRSLRTKIKSPQTNGIVECFHKTVLDEFYRVNVRVAGRPDRAMFWRYRNPELLPNHHFSTQAVISTYPIPIVPAFKKLF